MKFNTLVIVILLPVMVFSQKKNKTTAAPNLREIINTKAAAIEAKAIEWRHDIHQNPELSNREFRTAAKVAAHLKSLGMEVQEKVAHTGVVALLKGDKPGPVIALRADMDALPVLEKNDLPYVSKVRTNYNGVESGVMHACGHDTHVAILMGVAEVLASMKKDLSGTVKFVFQPAEEGAPEGEEGGGALMVKEGVLENPKVEAMFALHIDSQLEVGTIAYKPEGTFAAVNDLKIVVNGKPAHGAAPWDSVDPIVVSAQIINNLQTILSRNLNVTENAAVVTIGAIHGGNRSNIIPESVEMLGTVRTLSNADEILVKKRITEIVEGTAKTMGCTATASMPATYRYPVTYNDPKLTMAMVPSLQKTVGAEQVKLVPANTGAEDFSFFAEKVPGFYFQIGGMPKGQDPKKAPSHHTPQFVVEDSSLIYGIKAMSNIVFDYIDLYKKP